MREVLIVVPTYNESQNIEELVRILIALHSEADILVVDDGSPDGTGDRVQALARSNPHVLLLRREGKGGRGSAVLAGFTYGLQRHYAYFIEMDADFSHRPQEVKGLLSLAKESDLVVGSRYLPGSEIHAWGLKRTVFSYLANVFARFLLRIPISDYTNGFRVYSRKAIKSLEMDKIDARGYVVLSEVAMQLWKKNMRIVEMPTIFVNRKRGVSNLTFHEIREAFLSIVRIRSRYATKSS